MKKIITTLLISLTTVSLTYAADLVVQESGPVGTYSSITNAVTAAADGDRIIIFPKVGGDPWIENLTLNKSLELVSAQDGVMYKIQGDIAVVGQTGRIITIIGAELTNGEIAGITSGAWKTEVNILACKLHNGRISFSNSFKATIVSNILLNGNITLSSGFVIGNELLENYVWVSSNDTINVIANKMKRLYIGSTGVVNIKNNYIFSDTPSSSFESIQFTAAPTSIQIINNTIGTPSATSYSNRNHFIYDFNISGAYDNLLIKNNIFFRTTSNTVWPFLDPSLVNGTASSSYNYYYRVDGGATISTNSSEVTLSSYPIDNATGNLNLPTPAENGADPSFEFYDLDLTVGDAGCYGGSYTLDNYFPITGSSRVFDIDMPFGIISTGTLNIMSIGFDR